MHATSSLCCGGMAQYIIKLCRPWKHGSLHAGTRRLSRCAAPLCPSWSTLSGPPTPTWPLRSCCRRGMHPCHTQSHAYPKLTHHWGASTQKCPQKVLQKVLLHLGVLSNFPKMLLLPASEHVRGSVCCTQRNPPAPLHLCCLQNAQIAGAFCCCHSQREGIQSLDAGKRGSGGWECGGGGAAGAECAGSAAAVAGPRQQGGRRRHVHPLRRPARTRQVRPWATFAAILHNITHCLRQVQLAVEGDSAFSDTS